MTRGKAENHIYFSTSESDPHAILTPKATHPPTAVDILSDILRRDGAQVSAHSTQRAELDPFIRLARAADMYTDALTSAAEQLAGTAHHGPHRRRCARGARRHHRRRSVAGPAPQPGPAGPRRTRPRRTRWHTPRNARSATPPTPPRCSTGVCPPPATPPWTSWVRCAGCPRFPPAARRHRLEPLPQRPRRTRRTTSPSRSANRPAPGPRPPRRCGRARWPANDPDCSPKSRCSAPPTTSTRPTPASPDPPSTPTAPRPSRPCSISAWTPHSSPAATALQRWRTLAEGIDPHITADPFWPRLATHLDQAARAGADVTALVDEAMARHGALPDELPAAALWWRLAGTLAPATLDASNERLRPPWTAELHRILGSAAAETITGDPAWPALVAAVNASDWPSADLLAAAAEYLLDALDDDAIRPDEYARVLTYRVELLTHYAADIDADIPHPADAAGHSLHEPPLHPVGLELSSRPGEDEYLGYDSEFDERESRRSRLLLPTHPAPSGHPGSRHRHHRTAGPLRRRQGPRSGAGRRGALRARWPGRTGRGR